MADEMFHRFKKTPGPATYKEPVQEAKNLYKMKSLKNSFIDDACYKSSNVPAAKYNLNYSAILPRSPFLAKMNKGRSRIHSLQKSSQPGPGSYATDTSSF